jgi:hypothetical protein
MSWQHSPWPKEHHEDLIALVRAGHGGVLPEWAIAADLVFHADAASHPKRPVPFPGRRALERRWGVSERVARRCLADAGWQEKCDALKIPRPSRHLDGPLGEPARSVPATVPPASPPTSHPRPRPGTDETSEHAESVPAGVPATVPPASPPTSTRALIPPTSSPPASHPAEKDKGLDDSPTVLDETSLTFLQAAAYWGEVVHRAIGRRPSKGPARESKPGKLLFAACKQSPAKVLDALRFVGESQTQRAQDLRQYDGLTIETVLRHLDTYSELWEVHGDRAPAKSARAPPLNGRRMGHAGDGVLEAMWRERNPPSEVYDGDG